MQMTTTKYLLRFENELQLKHTNQILMIKF